MVWGIGKRRGTNQESQENLLQVEYRKRLIFGDGLAVELQTMEAQRKMKWPGTTKENSSLASTADTEEMAIRKYDQQPQRLKSS